METTMGLPEGSPWRHYEVLQRLSDQNTCCNSRDYAIDAALEHFLDKSTVDAPAQLDEEELCRVQASAARRHRHRARLARTYLSRSEQVEGCAEDATALAQLQRKVPPPQLRLVHDAAIGSTDQEMALARSIKPGALRARLLRARREVLAIAHGHSAAQPASQIVAASSFAR
jgi:hypothetical protein